ncbi:hypothetical protein N7449_005101, partial [Penicillium cf. viridicatum]
NNPDNDIDKDITNVPLNYRRLEQTKDNLVEALREVTLNNKGFRGYYRRIIRTRITAEDSEEINIIIRTGALPNNFPFPKIINDPSLIFSPYIFIFALSLRSPYAFLYRAPSKAIELPLKREVEGYYIFYKTDNQPMTDGAISKRLRNLGEIHGLLQSIFAYCFRYRGGKMLNESSAVSEAQQNLIIKQADTRTFLNHYLPRHIDTDIQ